jgi:hypothetical protein
MNDTRWHDEWRPGHPRPDFAGRVMTELHRIEADAARGWDAGAMSRRRAAGVRRGSSLAVLALAALLVTGVALGSFKPVWLRAAWLGETLADTRQEGPPVVKQRENSVRVELVTPRAPMEPQRRPARRPSPGEMKPAPAVEAPPRVVPIHYPPCHCSSGAVVCSCVD